MLTLQKKYHGFIVTCNTLTCLQSTPANVFSRLERLPFPDCHFDLVRSLYIEFCVPENKVDVFSR